MTNKKNKMSLERTVIDQGTNEEHDRWIDNKSKLYTQSGALSIHIVKDINRNEISQRIKLAYE